MWSRLKRPIDFFKKLKKNEFFVKMKKTNERTTEKSAGNTIGVLTDSAATKEERIATLVDTNTVLVEANYNLVESNRSPQFLF